MICSLLSLSAVSHAGKKYRKNKKNYKTCLHMQIGQER